ncbi:MAG: hypothetical protein ACR2QZ_12945 [Woeseiaceae bacterium]
MPHLAARNVASAVISRGPLRSCSTIASAWAGSNDTTNTRFDK